MSCTALITAVVVAAAQPAVADAPPVPRALQKTFEGVVRAYYAGDPAAVWRVLSPLVARWSDSQVVTLDRALAAQQVPGVGELLVEARMNLVQQNLAHALPEPQFRERMLLLAALGDRIQATLDEHRAHPRVTGQHAPPAALVEFENALWDVHVLRNKLLTAARAAQYAAALAARVTQRQRERLGGDEQTLLAAAGAPLGDIQAAADALDELDAELRLARLDHGLAVLEGPQLTEERLMAAWSTQHDAEVLLAFLKDLPAGTGSGRRRLTRAALARPGLADEIAARAERARQLAGPLAEKARNLFEGLHWWRRGRFGIGPELGGLAKSAAAAEIPGGLVWLYMPALPPLPDPDVGWAVPTSAAGTTGTDPTTAVGTAHPTESGGTASTTAVGTAHPTGPSDRQRVQIRPPVERRHHYTWAWEDRRIIPTFFSTTDGQTLAASRVQHRLSTFW